MKAIVVAALLALSFTTGFTCSKNQPETAPAETTAVEAAESEVAPATEETATEEAAPAAEEAATEATSGEGH